MDERFVLSKHPYSKLFLNTCSSNEKKKSLPLVSGENFKLLLLQKSKVCNSLIQVARSKVMAQKDKDVKLLTTGELKNNKI